MSDKVSNHQHHHVPTFPWVRYWKNYTPVHSAGCNHKTSSCKNLKQYEKGILTNIYAYILTFCFFLCRQSELKYFMFNHQLHFIHIYLFLHFRTATPINVGRVKLLPVCNVVVPSSRTFSVEDTK